MSLTNIISINCNEQNQARLLIRDREREAVVYFEDGKIVHANLDSQKGEDVIYELLNWKEGEFELEQNVPPPMHTVTTGWSTMLLEGLSRIDESRAGWEVALDEEGHVEKKEKEDEIKILERLAKALKMVNGIQGVLICSREGEVLSQDTNADPAQESTLIVSVQTHADVLGDLLNSGQVKQVILTGEKRRLMIVSYKQKYIVLSLSLKTSAESITPVIQMTLRRYR